MKTRLILVTFLAVLLGSVLGARAQQTTVAQAEADYRFQFDLYRSAYQRYQIDKAEYLRSATLLAEQEALESAKGAALARAKTLSAYTQWLRLQLLEFSQQYPKAAEMASRLDQLEAWFADHQVKIENSTSQAAFDSIAAEYSASLASRERLYLQSQIELKLAKLSSFRLEIMRLSQPLRDTLQLQSAPEILGGLSRVDENLVSLDTRIKAESEATRVLEGVKVTGRRDDPTDAARVSTKEIESLRQLTLTTINILAELENRYGK